MDEADRTGLPPEELEAQAGEQLPDRELMSVLEPPTPLRAAPVDPVRGIIPIPPESA